MKSDAQSMLRVISGGIDYVHAYERGVKVGLQEILGTVVDIDFACQLALNGRLAFIEDSRADGSLSQQLAILAARIAGLQRVFNPPVFSCQQPARERIVLSVDLTG